MKKKFNTSCKASLVSVIIPTYNRGYILSRSINSVLKQSYKNWECIIIDDFSSDNTKELIEKYIKKDKRIKYLRNTHKKGPSGARNCGIEVSKGEYVAFLDSDDEWMPFHLMNSVNALRDFNTADFCTSMWYIEQKNKLLDFKSTGEIEKIKEGIKLKSPFKKGNIYFFKDNKDIHSLFLSKDFLYLSFFWTSIMVIKKSVFESIGLFNEDLFIYEDIDLFHRLFLNFNFVFIDQYSAIWHEGIDNLYRFKGNSDFSNNLFGLDPSLLDKEEFLLKNSICGARVIIKRIKKLNGNLNSEISFLKSTIFDNYSKLEQIERIRKNYIKRYYYFFSKIKDIHSLIHIISNYLDKIIGLGGIWLRKKNPLIYEKLRKIFLFGKEKNQNEKSKNFSNYSCL